MEVVLLAVNRGSRSTARRFPDAARHWTARLINETPSITVCIKTRNVLVLIGNYWLDSGLR